MECRQVGTLDVARNDDSAVPVEDVLELAPVVHHELLPHADGRISWGFRPGDAAAAQCEGAHGSNRAAEPKSLMANSLCARGLGPKLLQKEMESV